MATNPTVEVVTVTPDMAAEWLVKNTHNRHMKDRAVKRYAADMGGGRWSLNGESIKFGESGRLIDGQNRLQACIAAQTSFQTLVVHGVPDEGQETVDVGVRRSLDDVLKLRGESYPRELAAGLVQLWRYEMNPRDMSTSVTPTHPESLALLERHPNIRQSIGVAENARKAVGLRSSLGVAGHYITSSIHQDDADEFWMRLISGANLDPSSGLFHLRRQLIDDRVKAVQRMTTAHVWARVVKAVQALEAGCD